MKDYHASELEHFRPMLPDERPMYSPKDLAKLLGRSDQFVRNLIEENNILGHKVNKQVDEKLEGHRRLHQRNHYMIPRDKVLLYLLSTANYEPDEFMDRLKSVVENRPEIELKRVLKMINELLK